MGCSKKAQKACFDPTITVFVVGGNLEKVLNNVGSGSGHPAVLCTSLTHDCGWDVVGGFG